MCVFKRQMCFYKSKCVFCFLTKTCAFACAFAFACGFAFGARVRFVCLGQAAILPYTHCILHWAVMSSNFTTGSILQGFQDCACDSRRLPIIFKMFSRIFFLSKLVIQSKDFHVFFKTVQFGMLWYSF